MVLLNPKEGPGLQQRSYFSGDAMDNYFYYIGLFKRPVADDEFSLFRCVSEQIFFTQRYYLEISCACRDYLGRHEFPKETTQTGRNIQALSKMYRRDFIIFKEVGKKPTYYTSNKFRNKVVLCESSGNHFDSVYTKQFQNRAAICQSILYQVLYKNIFDMPGEVDTAIEILRSKSGRSPRPSLCMSEGPPISDGRGDFVLPIQYGDSDYMKDQLLNGPPFPYRVVKALDPVIYRNIEYDAWVDLKKEQYRQHQDLLNRLKFVPGDKCLIPNPQMPGCLVNGNSKAMGWCRAIVQEVTGEFGPAKVFVEDLGLKIVLPYEHLRPFPISTKMQDQRGQQQFHSSSPPQSMEETSLDTSSMDSPEKTASGQVHENHDQGEFGCYPMQMQVEENRDNWRQKPTAFYQGENLRPRSNGFAHQHSRHRLSSEHSNKPQPNLAVAPLHVDSQEQNQPFDWGMVNFPGMNGSQMPPVAIPVPQNLFVGQEGSKFRGDVASPSNNCVVDLMQSFSQQQKPWAYGDAITSAQSAVQNLNNLIMQTPPASFDFNSITYGYQLHNVPPPPPSTPVANLSNPPPRTNDVMVVPYFPLITAPFFDPHVGPINFNSSPSMNPGGSDLPVNDLNTLRYFYNLGCEYHRQYCAFQNQNYPSSIKVPPGFLPPVICQSPMTTCELAVEQQQQPPTPMVYGQNQGFQPPTPISYNFQSYLRENLVIPSSPYVGFDTTGLVQSAPPVGTSTPVRGNSVSNGNGDDVGSPALKSFAGRRKFRAFRHRN